MRHDTPSITARKVALNIVSLGLKTGMEEVLPTGIVDATARLLVAADVVGGRSVRFTRSRWAVVIAEGLTQYLTPAAVRDLFMQCGAVTASGSRMAFTHVGTGADRRPDVGRWTWFTLRLLEASGEPWLRSAVPDELPAFLTEFGWLCGDADQLEENSSQGAEYFRVSFNSTNA